MAARRVRDPEDGGSIPPTLTRGVMMPMPHIDAENKVWRSLAVVQESRNFAPVLTDFPSFLRGYLAQ